ncbi:unnamed protein product [Danaus chrysippus]|uniref:(African queen) hypothetical protein n=1 Tax=Danaus chrysippus TaxID=151541 RepID=A0A8J2QI26_9NEOP|nr:unnamed protein product [Danaus chrysippus]
MRSGGVSATSRQCILNAVMSNLSVTSLIRMIVGSQRCCVEVASFCELVISSKEAASRDKKSVLSADPVLRKKLEEKRGSKLEPLLLATGLSGHQPLLH